MRKRELLEEEEADAESMEDVDETWRSVYDEMTRDVLVSRRTLRRRGREALDIDKCPNSFSIPNHHTRQKSKYLNVKFS